MPVLVRCGKSVFQDHCNLPVNQPAFSIYNSCPFLLQGQAPPMLIALKPATFTRRIICQPGSRPVLDSLLVLSQPDKRFGPMCRFSGSVAAL